MTGRKRADVLLVERGYFDSRAQARAAIEAGKVLAAGRRVERPSELIDPEAPIEAAAAHPWVSRAGLKLAHAFALWPIPVEGRTVLDIGASTGGFTEVCLSRGAAKVYAVDVGRGQLHPRLAADPRVISLEGVDARDLTPEIVPEAPGLIVCDASFIGLAKVLPGGLELAAPAAHLVCLVKPQFEVGPQRVGKGGLVRDADARKAALQAACGWLETQGWPVRTAAESPVTGGDGNVEFLVWARKRPPGGD